MTIHTFTAVECTNHIDIHGPSEFFRAFKMKQIGQIDRRIIDQDIDSAELCFYFIDHLIDLFNIRYITADSETTHTVRFNDLFLKIGSCLFGSQIVNNDIIFVFCQLQSNGFPNATGTACDKYDFAHNTERRAD